VARCQSCGAENSAGAARCEYCDGALEAGPTALLVEWTVQARGARARGRAQVQAGSADSAGGPGPWIWTSCG